MFVGGKEKERTEKRSDKVHTETKRKNEKETREKHKNGLLKQPAFNKLVKDSGLIDRQSVHRETDVNAKIKVKIAELWDEMRIISEYVTVLSTRLRLANDELADLQLITGLSATDISNDISKE
jgi:hypothetical protein